MMISEAGENSGTISFDQVSSTAGRNTGYVVQGDAVQRDAVHRYAVQQFAAQRYLVQG